MFKKMKDVLIIDPLCYAGHIKYNHGIIRAVSQRFNYDVIVNVNTKNALMDKGICSDKFLKAYPDSWNIDYLSKKMPKLLYHIAFRWFFLKVVFEAYRKRHEYKIILFTCVDVYAFMMVSWLFSKNCYVVDHGIGNISNSRTYRKAWNIVDSNINLIVLEDFIKEMVNKTLTKKRKIFVVRHPLPIIENMKNESHNNTQKVLLFAPSGSNDEEFIKQLFTVHVPKNICIVAKSSFDSNVNDNIILYSKKLSKHDYDSYMVRSSYILLPYKVSYNYRVSAVFFEAMVLGKPVAILNNNTLVEYKRHFPENVILFSSWNDLFKDVNEYKPLKDYTSFLNSYSDTALATALANSFEDYIHS